MEAEAEAQRRQVSCRLESWADGMGWAALVVGPGCIWPNLRDGLELYYFLISLSSFPFLASHSCISFL